MLCSNLDKVYILNISIFIRNMKTDDLSYAEARREREYLEVKRDEVDELLKTFYEQNLSGKDVIDVEKDVSSIVEEAVETVSIDEYEPQVTVDRIQQPQQYWQQRDTAEEIATAQNVLAYLERVEEQLTAVDLEEPGSASELANAFYPSAQ